MEYNNQSGFLLVNKPKGISSFACIRKIKYLIGKKIKIGHSGTLDNFASGLLIICIGRQATKQVGTLLNLDKKYRVKAKLGQLTDTLDNTGKIIHEDLDPLNITKSDLEDSIKSIGKSYIQTPPIFSALKYKGKPLYELARKGKDSKELDQITKNKQREVHIFNLNILNFEAPFFNFETHVSKGTYIRSLCNDIAKKLGTNATTYELERVAIGKIDISKSIPLESISSIEVLLNNLINIKLIE